MTIGIIKNFFYYTQILFQKQLIEALYQNSRCQQPSPNILFTSLTFSFHPLPIKSTLPLHTGIHWCQSLEICCRPQWLNVKPVSYTSIRDNSPPRHLHFFITSFFTASHIFNLKSISIETIFEAKSTICSDKFDTLREQNLNIKDLT